MEYAHLAGSSRRISRVGFGCEPLGGASWGYVDPFEIGRAVAEAVDCGVTLFDTADIYGLGLSEERLSRALGENRTKVTVISKFGVRWRCDPLTGRVETFKDCSPAHLESAIEGSLRRLRLDCIPIYLVHHPDPRVPIAETLGAVERIKAKGKIELYGLSNFSGEVVRSAASNYGASIVQFPLSLAVPAGIKDTLPVAVEMQMGIVTFGTLAQGLLTRKYGPLHQFDPSDRRGRLSHFSPEAVQRLAPLLGAIDAIARHRGVSVAQVAMRWVLEHREIGCALVGLKTSEQLADMIAATTWKLTEEEMSQLNSQIRG